MENNYTDNAVFGLSTDEIANIKYQFDAFIRNMYSCLPCKVLAVNGGGLAPVGTVNIKPIITQQTATGGSVPYPVIYNAPYFRLQGGTNAIIIDPEPGDIGFAVFSSRDISGVKRTRGDAATASLRKFSLSDAIYVNGILNAIPVQYIQYSTEGITIYSPKKVTVQAPDVVVDASASITMNAPTITANGTSRITLNSPLLQITGSMVMTGASGGGATTYGGLTNIGGVVKSNDIVLETHVHKDTQPGGGTTGLPE